MSAPAVDVDIAHELLDTFAPQCEVLTVYVRDGVVVRGERCTRAARWIVRSRCHCGRGTVDLVCNDDRQLLDNFLHRCEVCGCTNPPVGRTVEPL